MDIKDIYLETLAKEKGRASSNNYLNNGEYKYINIQYKTDYGTEEYTEVLMDDEDFADTVGEYLGKDAKQYVTKLIKSKEQIESLLDTIKDGLDDIKNYYEEFTYDIDHYATEIRKEKDSEVKYLKLEDEIVYEAGALYRNVDRKISCLITKINKLALNNN